MTDEVNIRRYQEDDHEAVRRIFRSGMVENYKNGILLALQSPKVIALLTAMFAIGSIHSMFLGVFLSLVGIVLLSSMIYFCYYQYARYVKFFCKSFSLEHIDVFFVSCRDHLNSDMADKALKYWTTSPNVFLVAISTSTQQVLGCISYRQIAADMVEMHRLSVDSKARGLGVGWNLAKSLFDTAKENGYKKLYLETSSAQIPAIKLYDRMNFSTRQDKKFGTLSLDALSGLNIVAYTYRL